MLILAIDGVSPHLREEKVLYARFRSSFLFSLTENRVNDLWANKNVIILTNYSFCPGARKLTRINNSSRIYKYFISALFKGSEKILCLWKGRDIYKHMISLFKVVLHAALGAIGTILTNKDHHLAYVETYPQETMTQSIHELEKSKWVAYIFVLNIFVILLIIKSSR